MYIIETDNLTKNYGKHRGISGVNLKVKEGEIFGFVGPNGAGKSTTIRTLLNFIFPTEGNGKILGFDIVKESKKIKEHIGYVPSEVKFYEDSKVKDIVKYSSTFYEAVNYKDIDKLYKLLEVDVNKKMSELSLGNKKKVAIIQALIHKPKLLILDEPTNGLDPLIQRKLFELLEKAKAEGTTIFFSSHNLSEVENVCDRVAVIKEGKIIDTVIIDKMSKKLALKVIVKSKEINDEIIDKLGGKSIIYSNNQYEFKYEKTTDELIKSLSKYKIDKLLISEQKLEDTFMKYYEGQEE